LHDGDRTKKNWVLREIEATAELAVFTGR